MKAVWKYDVPVDGAAHAVHVPGLPHAPPMPLHVACQTAPDVVQVWFLVDPSHPVMVERKLQVFGTGQPIPDGAGWVGTALAAEGRLVWHLFYHEGGA